MISVSHNEFPATLKKTTKFGLVSCAVRQLLSHSQRSEYVEMACMKRDFSLGFESSGKTDGTLSVGCGRSEAISLDAVTPKRQLCRDRFR